MLLEIVINAAHLVLLAAYFMRDILWLRVITVAAIFLGFPYYYFQPEILWSLIGWGFVFIIINVYRIIQIMYDRRPIQFTEEHERIWKTAFHRIQPRYARQLFAAGTTKTIKSEETIVSQGDKMDDLMLISEGTVQLMLNDQVVEKIGAGHFIGSAMFLETDYDMPSITTIKPIGDIRVITWNRAELRKLAEKDINFSTAIAATMGLDIGHMLTKSWLRRVAEQG